MSSKLTKTQLIDSASQLDENIKIFDKGIFSSEIHSRKKFSRLLVNGICFLPYISNNSLAFAPVKFLGNINAIAHEASSAESGGDAKDRISKILKCYVHQDIELENKYKDYVTMIGATPNEKGSFGHPRKYWMTPQVLNFIENLETEKISNNPNTNPTTTKQLIDARIGQGKFRDNLISYWGDCCCISKNDFHPILRASHIKPWRFSSDVEKLDVYNGLLLSANFDVLFDQGYISFEDDGSMLISNELSKPDCIFFGCSENLKIKLASKHAPFMQYHRENIFEK